MHKQSLPNKDKGDWSDSIVLIIVGVVLAIAILGQIVIHFGLVQLPPIM